MSLLEWNLLGLEIVSIRFSIRPPIAIRSGSKSKKFRSRSKIYDRNPTFLDFDPQSKLRSGLSIFLFNVRLLKLCKLFLSMVKMMHKLNI